MSISPRRMPALVREIGKFGIVGLCCAALDVGLLNLLVFAADIAPLPAKICSTAAATTAAFFMNRQWTYRHHAKAQVHREYAVFVGLNVLGLLVNLAVLSLAHAVVDLEQPLALNIANVLGIGVASVLRFVGYRSLLWKAAAPGIGAV